MTSPTPVRCAIYTRKSSEEGLEQSFNSLDAQREACEAYILSQRHEGWQVITSMYDDGGYSGGNMTRPALNRLLDDIAAKRVDTVVVYKVDRLTRSLADFAKIVEQFDQQSVSFVSVTQQFNTTTSMGRLTLNVLLSFAQFEREVTSERIRDKIGASKRKGMWMGGVLPIGYDLRDRQLIVNDEDAKIVKQVFQDYLEQGCVSKLKASLEAKGVCSRVRTSKQGNVSGGVAFSRGALYGLLQNRIYRGEIMHKGTSYPGQHVAIIEEGLWDQVQAQLKANLQSVQRTPRSGQRSLLVGLLYDGKGNRFTPSHTVKKGRRYRYYISQAVIKKGARGQDGPMRLPAKEIDNLIIDKISAVLKSPEQALRLFTHSTSSAEEIQYILQSVSRPLSDIEKLVTSTVRRAIVHSDRIEVQFGKAALLRHLLRNERMASPEWMVNDDIHTCEIAATLIRQGGEVRFRFPVETLALRARQVPSLIHAVARAHDWIGRIIRGETANTASIARETGLHVTYIRRFISLAFLAPDLIETILDGTHASRVSLADWTERPLIDWSQQRLAPAPLHHTKLL